MNTSNIRFTQEQEELLIVLIDKWYSHWKIHMTSDGTPHRLGAAKEELKNIITKFGSDQVTTCEHSGISFNKEGNIK